MIDVHAHFAEEGYEFPAEWEKIGAAGVRTVILAGDTIAHSRMHRAFAEAHEGCYYTAGVHPESANGGFREDMIEGLRDLCLGPKCVAVGEIGLDYHYDGSDRPAQRELFLRQIALASELGLPIQIHSRDACADTLAILREQREALRRGFLMHCYSYGAENLDAFAALGAYFSFGGVVCFKNARRACEAAGACPMDRILTETDSPYLSPFRGEKNSPANLPVIASKLAELKGISPEELVRRVRENAERLFPKLR